MEILRNTGWKGEVQHPHHPFWFLHLGFMSEQTARLVDQLRARVRTTIQRMTLAETAFGAVITLGVIAAVWLLSTALEAGLWLGTTMRTVLVSGIAVCALALIAYFLARPLLQLIGLWTTPSEETVARRIGEHYPEVSDRLVNVLQLAEGRGSHSPDAFVDRAVHSLSQEIESVEFEQMEDFQRARHASRVASLPVVGLLIFLIAAPSAFFGASQRLLAPATPFERPAPFQLLVEPGDTDLIRGDSLRITVRATGEELPQSLTVMTSQDGEQVVDRVTVRSDSAGVFEHTLVNVRQSMRYRVTADPVASAWYDATVEARPLVRSLQVALSPPTYTNLPERRLDANVGDVTGLPGTQVDLRVAIGGPPVDHALLRFDDGSTDSLAVQSGVATGSFTLGREGTYRIQLRSTNGVPNRDPIRYTMQLRADAQPSVVFLAPDPVADLPESLEQPLRLRLTDDFGIARLRLYYRVSERRYGAADSTYDSFDLPVPSPRQLDQQIDYRWALQEYGIDLAPGDVVTYYARVWDNDAVAGYKSARTPTQRLRLPSLAEKYEQLDEEQDGAEQQMQDMMRETESIREQFDELRDELRRKQDADWEDKRQLEQIQNRQQQLESDVENLSQQMEEMTRQMQEQNLASPETMKMYQELQQVVEEINSPELMEALQKLQESVQNLDLEQMQQALQNFEFSEQQYQERLQRSLELFKQIRMQQQLEEAARRADDLRQQQERLAEETQRRKASTEENESAENAPSEEANEGAQKTSAEGETAESSETSESEQEASDQNAEGSESGQSEQAQEGRQDDEAREPSEQSPNEDLAQQQERASEEMRELQEKLQEMRNEMSEVRSAPQQKMQELMQQMREQDLPQQMQQNSEQLRQNQLQDAQQGQQQMQQQLQQMQQQLQNMKQGMQGQQQQMNMAGLRQALENTLLLSRNQEGLRHEVNTLSADSPTLRRKAQEQVSLSEGLHTVSDSLQQLARNIPQMTRAVQRETGNALREMRQATGALSERNARTASGHQKGSMMHLNELALLLSELLNQMMQGGGSGSGSGMSMQQMIEQMQKMSQDQQQLNQQMQQMLNDMQGNRLSVDQQERLQQMARQQQAIKRQLEQLNQEGGAQNQLMGDLERIAEQMEETIQELQQNQTDRRTIERQQQILTRMLNAQKSLQQQGREEQREGREADDAFDRESPGELTREEQIDRLRRDLIRALETGYAPDYEDLIKRYFELLQQQDDT
jgi:hypothetical protein